MIAPKKEPTTLMRVMWLAVVLAGLAAVAYVLIGRNLLAVGDLQTTDRPTALIYVAAGSYLLGGLLILLRHRWLWTVGAVINALVMLVFFSAYLDRPTVLFSPGGLLSKTAQLLLEGSLIYLILNGRATLAALPLLTEPAHAAAVTWPARPRASTNKRSHAR